MMPEEWLHGSLGSLFDTATGSTPPKSNADNYGDDLLFVKPPELNNGPIAETADGLSHHGANQARVLPAGSILISCIGNLGKVGITESSVAFNQQINAIKPSDKALPRFMFYQSLTPSFLSQLESLASGTTVPIVNKSKFNSIQIVVPPISEQQRIVAILDQAFADIEKARANAEQNLKNARELFDSYLQQVFSQRGEGWVESRLGEVCLFENGDRGKNYPSRAKFVDSGISFINAGHIDDGRIDFSSMNYITATNFDLLSRGKVRFGDVLFCLRGSLGKFAVVDADIQGAIASSLVIIRPQNLSVEYLLHYLRSGLCKQMISKYAAGAAQPNLGAKDLAKFEISVPPNAQQVDVSKKLDHLKMKIEELDTNYQKKIRSLDELKKSLLQKAFSGELTKGKGMAA